MVLITRCLWIGKAGASILLLLKKEGTKLELWWRNIKQFILVTFATIINLQNTTYLIYVHCTYNYVIFCCCSILAEVTITTCLNTTAIASLRKLPCSWQAIGYLNIFRICPQKFSARKLLFFQYVMQNFGFARISFCSATYWNQDPFEKS